MQTPPDAFPPGTALTVGSHKISISKYISQGGFAYVYLCSVDPPHNNNRTACLKRVVVPNKWQLTLLRQEVDAMKRLRGNKHIVSYIDSHASRLPSSSNNEDPQYEVLLLMEYCSGKGLIDFMNQRLTHRLTEPEILSIMGQVTTAVAMCHHLRPPLIHRDIKIENVLIDEKGAFKLCDFGSAIGYVAPGKDAQEVQRIRNDVLQNTTPQYRAPEMIDLSQGFPIDDKSDIWALGVLLYKMCYYTTPFESPNQKCLQDLENDILNSSSTLRFPDSPRFSTRLKNIISCCLRGDPRRRPNALQLLQELSSIQGLSQIPQVIPYSVRHQKVPSESPRSNRTEEKEKGDVFSRIDKSRVLNMKARPKSEVFGVGSNQNLGYGKASGHGKVAGNSDGKVASGKKSGSIQDLVNLHLSESSSDLAQMRSPEESDGGTLEFLRSKQTGPSRQNTGGSIKSSIVKGLRRISTGGSIKVQNSGPIALTNTANKGRSSSSSENDDEARNPEEPKRRSSIQRRVQQLLNNKDRKVSRSASGYGRYTDQEDLSAINYKNVSANASVESLSNVTLSAEKFSFDKTSTDKVNHDKKPTKAHTQPELNALPKTRKNYAAPPPCPPSLGRKSDLKDLKSGLKDSGSSDTNGPTSKAGKEEKKKAPPKPSKPSHLKSPLKPDSNGDRRLSNSSEISFPDVEDLEQQFSRRFPSNV